MSAQFENVALEDVVSFVEAYPLAWIVPVGAPAEARLMPLMMELGADGKPATLLGHLPLKSPATDMLRSNPSAVCLFLGPNAYIPPGWISKPGWAPTWNFVSLKVIGDLMPDESLTEESVRKVVHHMESRAGSDWTVERVGPRFEHLLRGIIGFRMRIESLTPRFKTGQDESEQSYAEILSALTGHPLRDWMR